MGAAIIRKTKSFLGIPPSVRRLFFEAVITSAYVRLGLFFLPFKKIVGWLGTNTMDVDDSNDDNAELIKRVRFAMRLCKKYVPWSVECYAESLTAKIILRRRKISSVLSFGFLKQDGGRVKGHAWLRASGIVVTGHCDFSRYDVHSSFS